MSPRPPMMIQIIISKFGIISDSSLSEHRLEDSRVISEILYVCTDIEVSEMRRYDRDHCSSEVNKKGRYTWSVFYILRLYIILGCFEIFNPLDQSCPRVTFLGPHPAKRWPDPRLPTKSTTRPPPPPYELCFMGSTLKLPTESNRRKVSIYWLG